jgi:hypothetical protein
MGRSPQNALTALRSPTRALADLVDKFNTSAGNHPDLPRMARMIRQLADEIALRRGPRVSPNARAAQRDRELGLC